MQSGESDEECRQIMHTTRFVTESFNTAAGHVP